MKYFAISLANTPYFVSGPQGPAKFRLMPSNYVGVKKSDKQQRVQQGRWYHGLRNRKLHPLISQGKDRHTGKIISTCAKNLFANTDYNMPKQILNKNQPKKSNLINVGGGNNSNTPIILKGSPEVGKQYILLLKLIKL